MSKYHKNGSPKNEISGLKKSFFDFREMILALLVFDNQEYCIFIAVFTSEQEVLTTRNGHSYKRNADLFLSLPAASQHVDGEIGNRHLPQVGPR